MDYYSGAPDPADYEYDNNSNKFNTRSGNFFRDYSFLILLALAVVIALLILFFLFTSKGNSIDYNKEDSNSYLKELYVYGGTLEPEFSEDVLKYTIIADSDYITFECKAASDKATVEGCEDSDSVLVKDTKVSYNIKVTAEDKNVTRYYFTIMKSE